MTIWYTPPPYEGVHDIYKVSTHIYSKSRRGQRMLCVSIAEIILEVIYPQIRGNIHA